MPKMLLIGTGIATITLMAGSQAGLSLTAGLVFTVGRMALVRAAHLLGL